jgi:hypothetical protein
MGDCNTLLNFWKDRKHSPETFDDVLHFRRYRDNFSNLCDTVEASKTAQGKVKAAVPVTGKAKKRAVYTEGTSSDSDEHSECRRRKQKDKRKEKGKGRRTEKGKATDHGATPTDMMYQIHQGPRMKMEHRAVNQTPTHALSVLLLLRRFLAGESPASGSWIQMRRKTGSMVSMPSPPMTMHLPETQHSDQHLVQLSRRSGRLPMHTRSAHKGSQTFSGHFRIIPRTS